MDMCAGRPALVQVDREASAESRKEVQAATVGHLQGLQGLAEAFIFPKFVNYKVKEVRVRDKTSPFAMFHSKNFQ